MLKDFIIFTLFIPSFTLGESVIDFLNYTDYYGDEIVENVTFALVTDHNDLVVDVNSKSGNQFYNYVGDLVGWRDVTTVEFPYVVSIIHAEYLVHVCTGILVTFEAVLTFMQCIVRKKTVAGKVSQKLVELSKLAVVAGVDNLDGAEDAVFRDVINIVTPYQHTFEGQVVFLMVRHIPYTLHHRPVKLYSTDVVEMGRKFEEEAQKGFCEIVTWKDTILCLDDAFAKPKKIKAHRVKIGDPDLCIGHTHRLGVQTIGEWSIEFKSRKHCFVGMGGQNCGTAPGAPLVCRGAVYGITALGSSCSEFGDYGYFVTLNSSDIRLLYERAYPIERSFGYRNAYHVHRVALFPTLVSILKNRIMIKFSCIVFFYSRPTK